MENILYEQRRFSGVNVYLPPQDDPESSVVQADNLLCFGGVLQTRFGLSGQLTTPFASPCYGITEYVKPDLTTALVFSQGGRLWLLVKGNAAAVEILSGGVSLTLNSATVFIKRIGLFLYVCDGVVGRSLYRVSIDNTNAATATVVTSLLAPLTAPTSALQNDSLDAFASSAAWVPDSLSGTQTNRLLNPSFTATNSTLCPSWTNFTIDNRDGVTYNETVVGRTGSTWVLSDDYEGCESTVLTNDTFATDSTRHAKQFFVSFQWVSLDTAGKDGYESTVIALDGGGLTIATHVDEFIPVYAGQNDQQVHSFIADFSNVTQEIISYKVRFGGKSGNNHTANSVYYTNSVAYPFLPTITLVGTTAFDVNISVPTGASQGEVNGITITKDYTSAAIQNFSQYNKIAFGLGKTFASCVGLQFRIDLKADGATTWYSSSSCTVDPSGFASIDISTLDTLNATIRSAFRYLRIVFTSNFTMAAPLTPVFSIGPLTGSGNLSVGYSTYEWNISEINGANDPVNLINVVEGDGSPDSLALTPTNLKAMAAVVETTTPAAVTTNLHFWRRGGTFQDNLPRLVATVSVTADVAYGADPKNPYYSWNHTTKTLLDNTPDSFIFTANTQTLGRGPAPTGVACMAEFQGRLWCAVGSTLYGSWLITSSAAAALYFNSITYNDGQDNIRGIQIPVGGTDNDPIVNLVAEGGRLVVLKGKARREIVGLDPTNFSLLDDLSHSGVGCIAPRAVELVNNQVWALGASAIYNYVGPIPVNASQVIEKFINPSASGGTPFAASALRLSAMVVHSRRLLVSMPSANTDTAPTVTWVYDMRQQGWTRMLFAFTSAVSLSSQTDNDDLFMCGNDGQIYTWNGVGDKTTPTAAATAVTITLKSRAFGEEMEGPSYFRKKIPVRAYANLLTNESATATFTVSAVGSTVTWSQTYVVNGPSDVRLKPTNDARGVALYLAVSISTITPTVITSVAMSAAMGRIGD